MFSFFTIPWFAEVWTYLFDQCILFTRCQRWPLLQVVQYQIQPGFTTSNWTCLHFYFEHYDCIVSCILQMIIISFAPCFLIKEKCALSNLNTRLPNFLYSRNFSYLMHSITISLGNSVTCICDRTSHKKLTKLITPLIVHLYSKNR